MSYCRIVTVSCRHSVLACVSNMLLLSCFMMVITYDGHMI
nr:MAG TPA: hypothetical protein [Caudoviricetes sp.]